MWMQTHSGKAFVIADPQPDQIVLEDIARALSNQCRFAGHCTSYYSVAEHSVHVCNRVKELLRIKKYIECSELGEENRLILGVALLHDATEAYLLDIPKPLKIEPGMAFYRDLHNKTLRIILEKFGLPMESLDIVKQADVEMLATEKEQIMAPSPSSWIPLPDPLNLNLGCWEPNRAYHIFMRQAKTLGIHSN